MIERGLSMAEYRAREGVANSDLSNLMRSPAYAQLRPEWSTPATDFGSAVHCALLEPDELRKRYAVDPESPQGGYPAGWRNTKDYKAQRADALRAGVVGLLSPAEFADLERLAVRVTTNAVGGLIRSLPGECELSVFANDERRGLTRKIRPDLWIPSARMLVDVKTTRDHRARPFARSAHSYGYHRQAAYYLDTMSIEADVEHFVFLVVNSEAPYEVASYVLDADSIEQGRYEYQRGLDEWKRCSESGVWPCGSDEIEEIRLPEWAIENKGGDIWD